MRKLVRIAVAAAGIGCLPVLAQDSAEEEEDGGGFLENLIESRLSSDGFEVNVRGFEGALSSRATMAQIEISDDQGPWLTINDAVLDWNRSALLRGRVEIEELAAGEILLPRLPQSDPGPDVPQPEAEPFSLPDLPVSIDVGRIDAERIELGEPVIGQAAAMTLTGSARLADGDGTVDIAARRIDGEEGVFDIAGSFENGDRQLSVDLAVEEGPDGIIATLVDLPDRPALALSVEGAGPLSEFDATIGLSTDGEPRLQGTVALRESDAGQSFAVDLGGDVTPLFLPDYRPFFGENVQLAASGTRLAGGGFRLDNLDLNARSLTLRGRVMVGADGVPDLIDVTGEIAADDGPVLLPVGGELRVDRVGLDIGFDAEAGEEWTGDVVVEGLSQPGLDLRRVALDGSGIIAGSGESLDVEAGFDFTAEGLALEDGGLGAALGESIDGRIELGYEAGDPILMDVLRLAGAGFRLDGSGRLDPDGENVPLALNARLDADDLSAFAALVGQDLSGGASVDLDLEAEALSGGFDVTLEGRTQDLALGMAQVDPLLTGATLLDLAAERDGTGLRVERLSLRNEALDVQASADLTSDGGTAEAAARIDDLGRIDPDIEGPAVLTFSAVRPEDEWDIDLDISGAQARVTGDATLSDLEADSPLARFDLDVSAEDLSNFSVIAGRALAGSVDLGAEGSTRLDLSGADATLSGRLNDVVIDQDEIDRLLDGETTIAAEVMRDGPEIRLPRFRIENPQITATADAVVTPGQSDVDARIALADLSRIVPDMQGPATITLAADETGAGWAVDLDGEGAGARIVADVDIRDLDAEDVAPRVDGTAAIAAEDLSVFSTIADRELAGSFDLSLDGGARTDLSSANAAVTGRARDVALGQPELNRLLRGVTELDLSAEKGGERIELAALDLENPQVRLTGQGRYGTGDDAVEAAIRMPDLGAVMPEMSGPGAVRLVAEDTGQAWQVSLDGDGAGVVLEVLGQVTGIGDAPGFDGRVALSASDLSRFRRLAGRPLSGSVDLDAEGRVVIDGSRFDLRAEARAEGLRVGVEQADRILSGGQTSLDAEVSRDGEDAPVTVRAFRLDAPGLDATAEGQLLGGSSNLDFEARLADLGQFVEGLNGPLSASGRAGQSGQNVSLDVDLSGPEGITAEVSGSVAESFDRADLAVTGNAPLRLANPFISPRSVDGAARFDLSLDGPLAPRSLGGSVTVSNARLVDPGLPLVLNDLQGTVRMQGGRAQLNFTANKQDGGGLRLSGPVSLEPGYAADLTLELAQIVFEDPRLYRAVIDGAVTLDGALAGGATVGGELRLGETDLRVPSTGLGATGPIPDGLTHVGEPADVRRTRLRAGLIETGEDEGTGSGGGVAYPLDLTILAENRIFVRGRGLDAELGGRLQLGGTTANVIPSGQFDLIRGRIDILGQRLVMDEGSVTLQGDFDPRIRLVARTDAEEITVLIVVEGQATEPDISFRSEPDLPEDEVLSRLLFGQSIDDISPLQAAQLASAVATLAGRGGDGIVANLRQSTGLDDLDVTTDAEGNVGLRAGKYISENVYTDVEIESDGEATINLNLDVTRSITVRGGASNDGDTSLGVFFERDY